MSSIKDADLRDVLTNAKNEDIIILIDHITDSGKGRLSVSSETCKKLIAAKNTGYISLGNRSLIAEELSRFGGNSLANVFRGGSGVTYHELVCDVARHLKADFNPKATAEMIEKAILVCVMKRSLEEMTEEQKAEFFAEFGTRYSIGAGPAAAAAAMASIKMSGFAAYKMAAIVANMVAKSILGKGLTFAATGTMMRGISVFAGPVGWGVAALWTAFDLASPAYRVTVPCVLQIAYMRQRASNE